MGFTIRDQIVINKKESLIEAIYNSWKQQARV